MDHTVENKHFPGVFEATPLPPNRDPPRDMTEPVHNSVTAMAIGKPLLAHRVQETRQLAVMQGKSGFEDIQGEIKTGNITVNSTLV